MQKEIFIHSISKLNSLKELSPNELVDFLKLLIQYESAPSGPYLLSSNLTKNITLNKKVYVLFANENKHLAGTFSYIQSSEELLPSITRQPIANPNTTENTYPDMPNIRIHQSLARSLTPELQGHTNILTKKIHAIDKSGEITGLSTIFASSLQNHTTAIPGKRILTLLGEANFYTWMAYSLYDNIIDGEEKPLDAPAANIAQRLALSTYIKAGVKLDTLVSAFNRVDHANANEVAHCRAKVTDNHILILRIPDERYLKKLLSGRSEVHCLGPLEILRKIHKKNYDYRKYQKILSLYCAARQLNDDIHDWEEDILNGRITFVVAHLLRAAHMDSGNYDLATLVPTLRKILWQSELSILLQSCLDILNEAKLGYVEILGLTPNSQFEDITLTPIANAVKSAIKQLKYDKAFLNVAQF